MKGKSSIGHLKGMDYKGLQALAKDMGVSAAGKAEAIMARIAAVGAADSEDGTATAESVVGYLRNLANEERAAGELAGKEAAEKEAAGRKAGEDAAAGMVTVRAVTRFLDRRLNQIKDAGEAYSVSAERAAELAAAGVAEIVG